MLREAELFVVAERVLLEVLGRIREPDRGTVVPAPFDVAGYDHTYTLARLVEQHARDEADVPRVLAGRRPTGLDPLTGIGANAVQAVLGRLTEASCVAAGEVTDAAAVVPAAGGDLPVREHLLRLCITRSLIAHYVAAYLGSTACPLPEELARPLWELTAPDSATWRELGYFRAPLPIPALASWRDTFLRTAGHEPHPLGH